jgi:broad specificity phosphatase PhoE
MDVPLSPFGEAEAILAATALEDVPLAVVVSSPLRRAVFGAAAIRQNRTPAGPETHPGFRELCRGAWRGLTKEQIGADAFGRFNACEEAATPEGGESIAAVSARVLAAAADVLPSVPLGGSGAVVSHLWVTRSLLAAASDRPVAELAGMSVPTASVSCVEYEYEGGEVVGQRVLFQGYKPGERSSQDVGN